MNQKFIKIRGAREHNLQNVSIDIPRDQLIVITGVSGSGKSSLAFDTIYADGQRRYVESLSAYARQFLDLQKKPDVDTIEGLSPAISIEQKTTSKNPRSIVGTVTEIYDYMRLLWARVGVPYSPETGLPIESQTISQMVDGVLSSFENEDKIYVIAPVIRSEKGEHKKVQLDLQKQGFTRLRIDGDIYEMTGILSLDKNRRHTIEVITDRLIIKNDEKYPETKKQFLSRLVEDFEKTLKLANGIAIIEDINTKKQVVFSENFACPVSGFTVESIEPRLFSFNSPQGACERCAGLGVEFRFDPDLIIPDHSITLRRGAIAPFSRNGVMTTYEHLIEGVCRHYNISMDKPWRSLSKQNQDLIMFGTGDIPVEINWHGFVYNKPYEGVIGNLSRLFKETTSEYRRDEISRYQREIECSTCHGKRLNEKALSVKIGGKDIIEICNLSIVDCLNWFDVVQKSLSPKNRDIASRILKEITDRLTFLINVGLGYLTLSRSSGTLSGGESQRIRLASQIGSGLTGVLYVLDEPSIGLHQRDNAKLLNTLQQLKKQDNTVIVVEHDEDAIRSADYIVDMGLGAGINGGNVIAAGSIDEILQSKNSLTSQYLRGEKFIPVPKKRRLGNGQFISIRGARHNNLKNISIDLPLGKFICLTGVSGSGKSSLLIDTIYPYIMKELYGTNTINIGECDSITGINNIDKIIEINQSPIGRTPRSNPATYTGVFDFIRDWYANLPLSKQRGYQNGRFSFNVKGGRCEACQGEGVIKIEMHFLPDVYVECDECKGRRYNKETLDVKYRDKSIADVLDLTVDEALTFFENVPTIKNKLLFLNRVGLSYIKLGQFATTLSGGEAQRVKLAKELSKKSTGKTLYILDEPTTGLHFADVHKLLDVLHEFVDQGNTVAVIEHNLEVIKTADYIIDIGPEGGEMGGQIVAAGTPEEIVLCKNSWTGQYLKPYLKNK